MREERLRALRDAVVLAVLCAIWVLLTWLVPDFFPIRIIGFIPFFGFFLLCAMLRHLWIAVLGEEDTSPDGD